MLTDLYHDKARLKNIMNNQIFRNLVYFLFCFKVDIRFLIFIMVKDRLTSSTLSFLFSKLILLIRECALTLSWQLEIIQTRRIVGLTVYNESYFWVKCIQLQTWFHFHMALLNKWRHVFLSSLFLVYGFPFLWLGLHALFCFLTIYSWI